MRQNDKSLDHQYISHYPWDLLRMNTVREVGKMNRTIEKLLTTPTSLLSLNNLLLNKPQIRKR